eukprot:352231-Chlamydomonas_euryale.AAC.5
MPAADGLGAIPERMGGAQGVGERLGGVGKCWQVWAGMDISARDACHVRRTNGRGRPAPAAVHT